MLITLFYAFLTSTLDYWKALFYYFFHKMLSEFLLTQKAVENILSHTKQPQFNLIVFGDLDQYLLSNIY